jgi:hypothetical protein
MSKHKKENLDFLKSDYKQNGKEVKMNKETDMVNHPEHYAFGPHETIEVIEAWDLPYHLGNVVKYVSRAKRKGKELEDLKKAAWYLDRYIKIIENEKEQSRLF